MPLVTLLWSKIGKLSIWLPTVEYAMFHSMKTLIAALNEEVLSIEGSVMAAAHNTFYPKPVPADVDAVFTAAWRAYVDLRDAVMALEALHSSFVAARERCRPFCDRGLGRRR